ncbi:MAG: hypothetical protein ACLPJH_17295 [Myxococcaceae bacterium]
MKDGPFRHPFVRRVPLLLLVAAGVFLWRSELFPQPRTLVWELPPSVDVARAEVQLWKGSELIARAEWPAHPHGPLLQQLQLRAGRYRALAFLELAGGDTEQHSQEVQLGSEETLRLPLRPR